MLRYPVIRAGEARNNQSDRNLQCGMQVTAFNWRQLLNQILWPLTHAVSWPLAWQTISWPWPWPSFWLSFHVWSTCLKVTCGLQSVDCTFDIKTNWLYISQTPGTFLAKNMLSPPDGQFLFEGKRNLQWCRSFPQLAFLSLARSASHKRCWGDDPATCETQIN